MWVQSYVLWLGRTFSLVCLSPMLSWMWVQWIKCLENFPELWGQASYRFLHHSGCVNSCLDILFHYLTFGRFTGVPQVFTDLIPQHLTSHKGWTMFFVAWCILISTNRWRMAKACEIDLVAWYYFLLIFLVLIFLEKTLIFLRLMPFFAKNLAKKCIATKQIPLQVLFKNVDKWSYYVLFCGIIFPWLFKNSWRKIELFLKLMKTSLKKKITLRTILLLTLLLSKMQRVHALMFIWIQMKMKQLLGHIFR